MKKNIRSERCNLFEPNIYIGMMVKMSGEISTEEIQQAVCKAYEANEATMSKIVLKDNGDLVYEKMENSGCKFIVDSLPWKDLLSRSEHKAFDINEGELVRTFFTEENNEKILFIHAHHLVGDGQSVLILLNDIMDCLDGRPLTYKPMYLIDRNFLEAKAQLDPMTESYIKKVNYQWQKRAKNFTWDDYYAVHKKYWDNHYSEIEFKTFDVNMLKEKCPNGITINSYMVTELLREYSEYEVVGIPVSIRENGGMSNQTSSVYVKYKYNPDISFEKNAYIVHDEIQKVINDIDKKYFILLFMDYLSPSLIDAVVLQAHDCYEDDFSKKMAMEMGYASETNSDLGISNVKKINIPSVHKNFIINDIVGIPPKVTYVKDIVGISTYADILTLCYRKMYKKD